MLCVKGKKNKASTCLRINLSSLLGELKLQLSKMPVLCVCMCENLGLDSLAEDRVL